MGQGRPSDEHETRVGMTGGSWRRAEITSTHGPKRTYRLVRFGREFLTAPSSLFKAECLRRGNGLGLAFSGYLSMAESTFWIAVLAVAFVFGLTSIVGFWHFLKYRR